MHSVRTQGQRAVALVLGLMWLYALAAPAARAAPRAAGADPAVTKAAAWVATQQQPDGSFPGFGVGSTPDAIFALVAGGRPGLQRTGGGVADLDFLVSKAPTYATSPGAAAKLLLAQNAATGGKADPHSLGGFDLLQVINAGYDAAMGHYGKDVTGQALVILALSDSGQPVPPAAINWLAGAQGPDGGWAFDGATTAGSADTNTTGLVLQALAAAKATGSPVVQKAVAYLHAQQNADGGFAYQKGTGAASDANSTATVIMGLRAAGEDAAGAAWQQSGHSPIDVLRGLQNASGAFRYQAAQAADNAGATYQAVPALAGYTLPLPHTLYVAPAPEPPSQLGGKPPSMPTAVPTIPPTIPPTGTVGGTVGVPPGMPPTGAPGGWPAPLAALLLAALLVLVGRRLVRRPTEG